MNSIVNYFLFVFIGGMGYNRDMYDPIAEYYEEIFAPSDEQIDFVAERAGGTPHEKVFEKPRRLLDIGCAVGELSAALTHRGFEVKGIDLNGEMIRRARVRHAELAAGSRSPESNSGEEGSRPAGRLTGGQVRFSTMDMRDIANRFSPGEFDTVLCLGNTLVHLTGPDEILDFLRAARKVINDRGAGEEGPNSRGTGHVVNVRGAEPKRGRLILQILNYDQLLASRPAELPPIETKRLRFERWYEYPPNPEQGERIRFFTRLTVGETVYEDSVELYPLGKEKLTELMQKAGFGDIRFYGSFSGKALEAEDFPLIAVGKAVQ